MRDFALSALRRAFNCSDWRDGGAPLLVELAEAVEGGNVAAGGEALRDPIEVAPE